MATTNAVFKAKNTTEDKDDSAPVNVGQTYQTEQSVIVRTGTGSYVDVNGRTASENAPVEVMLPQGATAGVISAGAEITVAEFLLVEIITGESGGAGATTFVPHIFEVSGVGAGSSGGSPHMFKSFVAEQDGFYLPEPTEYDIYRNQSGTNRVSAHIQLNSSTTGGGTTSNPNELWRQYLQKASRPAGSTTDIAVTNDNGGPYIASVPVQLVAGATYYLYHISNTGQFRNSDTASVKFTRINTDPQLELPTSMGIVNQTTNGAQNLNDFVDNAVYRSNNTGPLNGTGLGNWTWRVKATRIGNWCQQMMFNDTGNIAFRESFNADAATPTWTAWAI